MRRLRHAVFGTFMAIISGAISIPAYAYYQAETSVTVNAVDLSHVSLISFKANGGTGTMPAVSIALGNGNVLPANKLTKTGYTFTGWNTKADGTGTAIGNGGCIDTLPYSETATTLYAQWRPNTYTVSYDANGGSGSAMASTACTYDKESTAPANTYTYADHLFVGWNTKADGTGTYVAGGGALLNLTAADNGSVTLYAQWEDESQSLIETRWDETAGLDGDGNGTADRLELKSGSTCTKDPSLKNHTSERTYGYILVSVPTAAAKLSGDTVYKVYGDSRGEARRRLLPHSLQHT
ncbi:MAG: InlB B-repeat-containing protein [Eubacteriales bacterium]|nr:InlB B-repeat-containing protein [Eubacteriales bacterium]